MKSVIKIIFECFISILAYVPEKWHNNKWFWLFWLCVAFLVSGVFMYVFM